MRRYRQLGITTRDSPEKVAQKRAALKATRRSDRYRLRVSENANIIRNLPKNVPY